MNAEIITIGDELLIGQIINTNQAYIAERLNSIGVHVARMTTAGDEMDDILAAFAEARARSQAVIVTGGLGPTHDDITKKAVCRFFDSELESDAGIRSHVAALLQSRNMPWGPTAEEQTMFPVKARIIPNPLGTAAGMHFDDGETSFFILPGVPYEMKEMIDETILPFLSTRAGGTAIMHKTLRTTGASESFLAGALGDVEALLEGAKLAFLPSPTGVRLRITVREPSGQEAMKRVARVEQRIRERVGKFVYGLGEEELEDVVGQLLTERKLKIAVAESCTGGRIADRLTNISGSSAYFERGFITYSNRSKTELLGVPEELIARVGAVSAEVAEAMAVGVRVRSGADIGLSTTGIAGPTGGTEEKPVGLVWIAYADGTRSFARRFSYGEGRLRIKERAATAAIETVRRQLLNIDVGTTGR